MKILLISMLLLIGLISTALGQKNTYGISIRSGKGMILTPSLEGGPSYDLNTSISFGFQYSPKLTSKLRLLTSINWYKNEVTVTPQSHPDMDMTPKNYDAQLIYLPVFIEVDLSKHFFLNGGLIADFDITKSRYITNQSGAGAGLGVGVKFSIKDKFSIRLNPHLNFHALLLAKGENYSQRIIDSGITLSLMMNK